MKARTQKGVRVEFDQSLMVPDLNWMHGAQWKKGSWA